MTWQDVIKGLFISDIKQAEKNAYKKEALRLAHIRGIEMARKDYPEEYKVSQVIK